MTAPGDETVERWWDRRRRSRFVLLYLLMAWTLVMYVQSRPPVWQAVPAFLAAAAMVVLGMRTTFVAGESRLARLPFWPSYAALVAVCLGLPLLAGPVWTIDAAWAAAATGWLGGRWFAVRLWAIALATAAIDFWYHVDSPIAAWITLMVVIVGFFSNQARRQLELFTELQSSRRELARLAVVDERNRIARDLHDLVGHSLSVIAVKNELARRLAPVDPARCERELADVDGIVRRALSEVRQAVTNYRQPTLAGELSSARRAAASAGIDCLVTTPDSWDLPPAVDGLLAWTVREGVTNLLRHSRARHCTITLAETPEAAEVEITDDGVGPSAEAGRAGNGLAGLVERAHALGGSVDVGRGEQGGFRLRVRVPAGGEAA